MPEASMGWVSQQREKLKLAGKSNVERKLRSLCRKYMDFILLVGDGDGHRGEGRREGSHGGREASESSMAKRGKQVGQGR
jgi:hypothetical protein